MLDGFEVMELPAQKQHGTKYAELFDKALEVGAESCVAKTYGTAGEAHNKSCVLRDVLKRWSRRNTRWKCLEVFYRGTTVYVHAKEESDG